MKLTPLRKSSKTPVALCKIRIQPLVRETAIIRDGGCVLRHYPEAGACGGYDPKSATGGTSSVSASGIMDISSSRTARGIRISFAGTLGRSDRSTRWEFATSPSSELLWLFGREKGADLDQSRLKPTM